MNRHPEQPDRTEGPERRTSSSEDLRQLQRVTAPVVRFPVIADSRETVADTETTALRESWLALGQLLETNTPAVDEAALLAQVRRRIGRQEKRQRWERAGLALAASLLLVVSVTWLVARSSRAPAPDNLDQPIARTPFIETPVEQPQPAAGGSTEVDLATADWDEAYWQDDLADDLAQTRQELVEVQTNWARLPDPMAWMQFQLNEFEHELGESSL